MHCPTCQQAMKKVRWDISYNRNENNKPYHRTTYQYTEDDVWVTTEIPQDVSTSEA